MDLSTNIEIYLAVRGDYIAFLSIPPSDIQRLSTRPFKWMRFVMFSICGTKGDLFATPDGLPVNYESTLLNGDRYYYKPSEEFSFVDPNGLNDQITSSARTPRSSTFREDVIKRDGECIFSEEDDTVEAVHLIPKSKGDEYIAKVIERRAQTYDLTQVPTVSGIDAVENGMLLSPNLHSKFGDRSVAFLKTPNFAMDSSDIPRIERGTHRDQVTLHQFWKPRDPKKARDFTLRTQELLAQAAAGNPPWPDIAVTAGLNIDALFSGPDNVHRRPPAIILDFTYGVAAYYQWHKGSVHDVVQDYFKTHFESIPAPPRHQASDFDDSDAPASASDGSEYLPPRTRQNRLSKRGNAIDAMDEMNLVMMYLSGITPEVYQKQLEEEELRAQEASRSKVTKWRKAIGCL